MRTLKQQRGMSLMGLMFLLGVIAITTIVTLKLVPFYNEYSAIVRSVEQLHDTPDFTSMGATRLKGKLLEKLYLNDVRAIKQDNLKEHFLFEKTANGPRITIRYNREAHMVQNVYLLVKFDHTVEP